MNSCSQEWKNRLKRAPSVDTIDITGEGLHMLFDAA